MAQKLASPEQIWVLQAHQSDRQIAAEYAERTLPWTFNRMMLGTSSAGQKERGLNIAKGILAQEMLRRALAERGITFATQRKSHRDDDLFDFRVPIDGSDVLLDIKTLNYYTDYKGDVRQPLTPEFIIANRTYSGPDWRQFFPMMIPHTQLSQHKEVYCFAIAKSVDPRATISSGRDGYWLCAFPFGRHLGFMSSKKLCREREAQGKGFYVRCQYQSASLFSQDPITLTIVGEWEGKMAFKQVVLQANDPPSAEVGPFSIIDSFKLDHAGYLALNSDALVIECSRNDYTEVVRNTRGENINQIPAEPLQIRQQDFCNLLLPSEYTLYVLGWITKPDYLTQCRLYPSWVWPNDKVSKFENQAWTQITQKDQDNIDRAGFSDCIEQHPTRFNAGWLKTTGLGSGACCYVFPNVHSRGGVSETNLYVLPQDLHLMEDLL
jgi:hypothetical protein